MIWTTGFSQAFSPFSFVCFALLYFILSFLCLFVAYSNLLYTWFFWIISIFFLHYFYFVLGFCVGFGFFLFVCEFVSSCFKLSKEYHLQANPTAVLPRSFFIILISWWCQLSSFHWDDACHHSGSTCSNCTVAVMPLPLPPPLGWPPPDVEPMHLYSRHYHNPITADVRPYGPRRPAMGSWADLPSGHCSLGCPPGNWLWAPRPDGGPRYRWLCAGRASHGPQLLRPRPNVPDGGTGVNLCGAERVCHMRRRPSCCTYCTADSTSEGGAHAPLLLSYAHAYADEMWAQRLPTMWPLCAVVCDGPHGRRAQHDDCVHGWACAHVTEG